MLYFQLWTVRDDGRAYWTEHDTVPWLIDRDAPWPQMVAVARESALLEAAFIPHHDHVVATVEWVDQSDI